jgi:NitT/TauT family transport system substrate-binding protein
VALAQPGELQKVKIASGGHIVHFLPLDLANALGFFQDEGLEPDITYLQGGTATAQALITGQVQFSTNSIDHAYKSAAQGKDNLRMVVLMNQTPGMVLVVSSKHRERVKSIADLKGMKLGVTSKGSATHMVLAFLLAKHGVDPNDVTILKAGDSTFAPTMKAGDIDGGMALEPFASAMVGNGEAFVLQRLVTREDSQDAFGGPFSLAGLLTRQDVIDSDPRVVQKVVNVIVRTLQWMQGHTEDDIASVLPMEVMGSDKNQYVSTLRLLREFYSHDGRIDTQGATNIRESMVAANILPPSVTADYAVFYTNIFVDGKGLSAENLHSQTAVPPKKMEESIGTALLIAIGISLVLLTVFMLFRKNSKKGD